MPYVMMAIPAELVGAVTDFIERQGGMDPKPPLNAGPEGFVNGWDGETVQRAYRESADRMRSILRFLAANPGREVGADEIADAIHARFGWNTIAGMLGAFGRRSANRYRKSQPMWEYRYDDEGRIRLTMPDGAAKTIREASGS